MPDCPPLSRMPIAWCSRHSSVLKPSSKVMCILLHVQGSEHKPKVTPPLPQIFTLARTHFLTYWAAQVLPPRKHRLRLETKFLGELKGVQVCGH